MVSTLLLVSRINIVEQILRASKARRKSGYGPCLVPSETNTGQGLREAKDV